jgi:hypothetical protein
METLVFLIPAVVSILTAILVEKAPYIKEWFFNLTSDRRFILMLVVSVSAAIGNNLHPWLYAGNITWEGFGSTVLAAVVAWLSSMGAHSLDKFLVIRKLIKN